MHGKNIDLNKKVRRIYCRNLGEFTMELLLYGLLIEKCEKVIKTIYRTNI